MEDSKEKHTMFAEERKQLIVDLINKQKKATVSELCNMFAVSPGTIRNDLRELEENGLAKRTHGGAISNIKANFERTSFEKTVENIEEKQAIAIKAAEYVDNGDTIALDTGTTMFEFAKELCNKKDLTVVTNDISIAMHLERNSNATIILTSGIIRRGFHCALGTMAINSLTNLNVDKSFLAANGCNIKKGITTPSVDHAQYKNALIRMTDDVILLCDSSKMGRSSFVKAADFENINLIITDSKAPGDITGHIRSLGIDLDIVEV